MTNTAYAWAWPRVAPALYRAIDRINSDPTLLPGLRLRLVHGSSENRDGFCSDLVAPLVAVDFKFSYDPWAFIGPGCDYASAPVGRFTSHWEVPMVTAGARAIGFKHFDAVTNTGPTHKKLGEFTGTMQWYFGWHRHAMLVYSDKKDNNNDDRQCYFTVEGLYTVLQEEKNISVVDRVFETDKVSYEELIRDISQRGRGEARASVFGCVGGDVCVRDGGV